MATQQAISPVAPSKGGITRTTNSKKQRASAPSQPPTTAPIPLKPRQLPPEERRDSHYVLVCNGEYLHEDEYVDDMRMKAPLLRMTPSLRKAWLFGGYPEAKIIADMANSHPEAWVNGTRPGNLEIQRVESDLDRAVAGSAVVLEDDDEPILSRKALTKWGGTRHNTALAHCAEVEDQRGDPIAGHITMLSVSPMYKLLVEAYKADLAQADGTDDPEWYRAHFAARMFYAGVIAGREEAGLRNEYGELVLDAPGKLEPADQPIHPENVGGAK